MRADTGESHEPSPTHVSSFDVLLSSRTAAPHAELAWAIASALVDAGCRARTRIDGWARRRLELTPGITNWSLAATSACSCETSSSSSTAAGRTRGEPGGPA